MELIYEGKTKDVYRLDDNHLVLQFKDEVLDANEAINPYVNTIGETINNSGRSRLGLTTFFYKKLNALDVPTHFISSNIEDVTMIVKPTTVFQNGLSVICRFELDITHEEQEINSFIEVTLKDNQYKDFTVSKETLLKLKLLTEKEFQILEQHALDISNFVRSELAKKGLSLSQITLEFGRDANTGEILLIDEISGKNIHVVQGQESFHPLQLEQLILKNGYSNNSISK